jgi:hypothetical protein
MKKHLPLFCGIIMISVASCIKPATSNNGHTGSSAALDISGFAVKTPSKYAPGNSITVELTAPKLANGPYTYSYSLSGQNYGGSYNNVDVTFTGGKGTFTTPVLPSAGCMKLSSNSIQSLTNANGANSISSIFAVADFCDSLGVMDAMRNGIKFYTTHITSSLSNSTLQVSATVYDGASSYDPGKTIQLTVQNYTQSPKTVSFTASDYYNKGYATYTSPTNNQYVEYGKISITAASPTLSGNFSFTTEDSSKFSGTFSVAAP